MHAFELVAIGPPFLSARCRCGAWNLALDEDALRRFPTIEPALEEIVARWDAHASGRRDLSKRTERDEAFY